MADRTKEIRSFVAFMTLLIGMGLLLALSIGCSSSSATGGEWQYEETIEGDVRTIRTLSGSVWGGEVRLVEEASIGVLEGADEHMFGDIRSLWQHEGRLFVLDSGVPALRVYDLEGSYMQDIGGSGSGPGEYLRPRSIAVSPVDGTIYVRDGSQGRLNRYTFAGDPIDNWPLLSGMMTSTPLVMTPDGRVFTTTIRIDWDTGLFSGGYMQAGPEGAIGDTLWEPEYDFDDWQVEARNEEDSVHIENVPFAPSVLWTLCPDGTVVGGVSEEYRFDLFYSDGRHTVVEKTWERVPVLADEARWYRDRTTADLRTTLPGWAWNGPEVPRQKPAFADFIPDRSGRLWVRRQGPGVHLEEGDDHPRDRADFYARPAWRETFTFDVFDLEGRFLGSVPIPDGFQSSPEPFIVDDLVLALVEDDEGVQYVRRYRLVIPSIPER